MNVLTLLCCSSIKLPFSTLLVSPGTDECSTRSYVCDINANCTKTNDSYICACRGYTGDRHSCQGIIIAFDIANSRRKFLTNKKKKLFPLKLRNLMFFSLSCNILAINFLFTDVNECSNGNHVCHVNSNCNNTNGSHICTCKEGYAGDGQSCQGE